jgi:tetratricopeptide (TPR) repeat protein
MNEKIDKARIIELAERQVKAGRIEEAIAEYKKLLAGKTPDFTINNIIGDLYVSLGRNDEAIKAFQGIASYYESKGFYSQALAIYKKISKIDPDNVIIIVRMGDLFDRQGFSTEAKREYLKAEQRLRREKRTKELMFLYDKLIKLDRENISFKLALAELLRQEGFIEESVSQLNDAAELLLGQGQLEEAGKIIRQSQSLRGDDERTLTNLVEVLKRSGRRKEAVEIVEEILSKDKANIHFQNILGTLYLEEGELKRAREIFAEIIAGYPLNIRARIKLGKVYSLQEKPEKAYEILEPLIANLIKKQKEDKAIGLLGIILSAKRLHLPALEKLAAIYKFKNQKGNLEVVYRAILGEARAGHLTETMFVALAELMELCPKDEDLVQEYWSLRKKLGFVDDKLGEEELLARASEDGESVDLLLAKVDLYVSQGLIRNARRILENLSQKFPHSSKIEEKITTLEKMRTDIKAEEIPFRVGKIQKIEEKIEATPELAKTFLSLLRDEEGAEKRVTAADLFADTEILPLPSEEAAETRYYDLGEKIEEELVMIRTVFSQQLRGDISILERDLSEIVRDFKEQVRKRIDSKDYETRFHLGLAFLEQGLFDDAIEEFLLASEEPGRTLECYSIISKTYLQKNDLEAAFKWLQKCLNLVREGSDESYFLEYELASLHEDKGDKRKALELYKRVKDWNPGYRDVQQKIKTLAKNP